MTASSVLRADGAPWGLRRVVLPSSAGAVTIHVGTPSGGPATILLHGAAGSWTTWTPLLEAAARRGAPLTDVIAIDLPGWGDSPGPARVAELPGIVARIARDLGYERWRIVGHSLGGAIALDVAAREPVATEAVGLVSASGAGVRDAVRRPWRGGLRLPGFAGMLVAMRLLRTLGRLAPPLLRGLRATGLLRLCAAPLFAHPSAVPPTVTDALADEVRPAAFVSAALAARTDDEDRYRDIRCPVRGVVGAHDVFARLDDGDRFAELVPDFRETVLSDAGHFAHVEAPEATLDALEGVLGRDATRGMASVVR